MGRLFAPKRAAALGVGFALLISAAPASAEVVDLFQSNPGNSAIVALLAGAGASAPAADVDNASASAADRDAGGATSSPVPEPGAWALLLLGFFGLGLGMYRKRYPRLASLAD